MYVCMYVCNIYIYNFYIYVYGNIGGFRPWLEASDMSNYIEELWNSETVGYWMTI